MACCCLTTFFLPVLRVLCKNPHGLFWAGDTAQTISVGSSFRFDDLKAFLFRIEVGLSVCLTDMCVLKILCDSTKGKEKP